MCDRNRQAKKKGKRGERVEARKEAKKGET